MAKDKTVAEEVTAENATAAEQEAANAIAAGHAKREALKRRLETTLKEAEELRAQVEMETADPSKLTVDREVRNATNEYNEVWVSNADPNYRYAWVFRDPTGEYGGRAVRKMQVLGWEVVKGEMPEAIEHSHIEGRVVADCLLMRCRLDHWMVLQKRDRLLRQAQQEGVYTNLFDVADEAGRKLGTPVNVWDIENMPGGVKEAMTGQADARTQTRAQALGRFHQMNARGGIDRMLKGGSIPGVGLRTVAGPGRVR